MFIGVAKVGATAVILVHQLQVIHAMGEDSARLIRDQFLALFQSRANVISETDILNDLGFQVPVRIGAH